MHSFMIGRQAGQNLVEVWYLNANFNTLWEYLINRIKYLESCILVLLVDIIPPYPPGGGIGEDS